jgi:hypothetical protein
MELTIEPYARAQSWFIEYILKDSLIRQRQKATSGSPHTHEPSLIILASKVRDIAVSVANAERRATGVDAVLLPRMALEPRRLCGQLLFRLS